MTPLERRYRWLLRAYPGRYRRERGEEIIGTLLEASGDGQNWPRLDDARTLIMGGILVRRGGQNHRLTAAANLRLAALLGVALALLWLLASRQVAPLAMQIEHQHARPGQIAYSLLALAAVAAAWFAPRLVVAGLALPAAALWMYWGREVHLLALLSAGLLILLAVLARGQERMPRSWFWLADGLFALVAADAIYPVDRALIPRLVTLTLIVLVTSLVLVIVWSIVDARPLIAVAICLASYLLSSYLRIAEGGYGYGLLLSPIWLVPAAVTALLAAAGVWRLRRQAAL